MSAEIPYINEPRPDTGLTNGKLGMWLFLASEVMLFGALFSAYVLLRVGSEEGTWPLGSDILNVPIGAVNTIVLITSSVSMVMAWASLKLNQPGRARLYLAVTLILAVLFLVVKLNWEYRPKLHHYSVWMVDGTHMTGHLKDVRLDDDTSLHHHPAGKPLAEVDHIMFTPDAEGDEHPEPIRLEPEDIRRISNFGPAHDNYLGIYWTMTGLHGLHVLGGVLAIGWFLLPGMRLYRKDPVLYTNRIEYVGLYWHFVDLVWIFLFPIIYLL